MKNILAVTLSLLLLASMANAAAKRVPELTAQSETIAEGDLIMGVDVSDTTDHATGTSKKLTWTQVIAYLATVFQASDADISDLADGSLTGTKVGFADTDNLFTASNLQAAIEELNDSINTGTPNGTGAKVHWSQLLGVPAGFADGADATGSGYTNLTSFVDQTAYKLFYSDSAGDVKELSLGSDGTYLRSNGAAALPTFDTPSGAAHDAVTIGSPANGLSLATQQLSLALASTSTTGALSDTDWDTFNNKPGFPGSGIPLSTGSAWGTSYTLDTDISSVSASDDTLPSAKATKTALDLKANASGITFLASALSDMKILTTAQPVTGENLIDGTISYGATDDHLRVPTVESMGALLSGKQAADSDLTALAALTTTATGLSILDDATTAAMLTTLGLTSNGQSLVTAANYAAMRTLLDLEPGVDYDIATPSTLDITTDTSITSAQLLTNKYISNQGASGEVDITLPAVSYSITRTVLITEAQIAEINPPSGEQFDLSGTLLTADYCIDSPATVGAKAVFTRMQNASGTWHWSVDVVRGTWADTGVTD